MAQVQTIAEMQVVYSADGVRLKEVTREVGRELSDTEKEIARHEAAALRLGAAMDPLVGKYSRVAKSINAINALEASGAPPEKISALRASADAKLASLEQQKTVQQQVAEEAQRAAEMEVAAQQKVAQAAGQAAEAESAATKRFLESIDPMLRAFNRLDESVAELHQRFERGFIPEAQFKTTLAMLEQQRAKLYELSEAAEQAGHTMGGLPAELSRHELAAQRAGISVGQYTQALRFLPAQMSDVVTQLAGGQNPLLILLEQGGQIKDSFGGLSPMFMALRDAVFGFDEEVSAGADASSDSLSDISEQINNTAEAAERLVHSRGALVALVAGISGTAIAVTALIATVATIPYSMSYASESFEDMHDSLVMTGAAAWDTAGKMADAAQRIGHDTDSSFAATAEMMSDLVRQGKFTGGQIEAITRSTQNWSRATGESAQEIEQRFGTIADGPVQAMKKLNEQYDFLTVAQAKHIVMLDKAGKHTEAVTALTNLFADTMDKRSKDIIAGMSPLEQLWVDMKTWASDTTTAVGVDFNAMSSLVIDVVGALIDQIRGLMAHGNEYIFQSLATITDKAASIPGMSRVFDPMTEGMQKAVKEQQVIWQAAEKDNAERLARVTAGMQGYRDAIWKGDQITQGPHQKDAVADVVDDSKKHPKAYQDDEGTRRLATLKEQTASLREQGDSVVKLTDSEKKLAAFEQEIAGWQGKTLTSGQQSVLAKRSEIEAQLQINIGLEKQNQHLALAKKMAEEQKSMELATAKIQSQAQEDVASITLSQRVLEQRKQENQIHEDMDARRLQLDKNVTDKSSDLYKQQTENLAREERKRVGLARKSAQERAAAEQDFLGGAKAGMQDWVDAQGNLADRARQATVGMFDSMSGAVANFAITGKGNFRSFTVEILKDIAKIALQVAISKAVGAILSSFAGGASGGGTTPGGAYNNAAANVSFNALGGVYSSPSLSAFSGQMVSHPTMFAFAKGAGVMGEAGPEGIFPLRRGADGKLGVVASMAGGGTFAPQYNIAISNDGQNGQIGPQALQAVYNLGKKAAADYIREQQRAGGALRGTL